MQTMMDHILDCEFNYFWKDLARRYEFLICNQFQLALTFLLSKIIFLRKVCLSICPSRPRPRPCPQKKSLKLKTLLSKVYCIYERDPISANHDSHLKGRFCAKLFVFQIRHCWREQRQVKTEGTTKDLVVVTCTR